jgi:hypothetical protein
MAPLTDTDLLAVGRGAATYKTTFKNIKDSIGGASTTTKGIVQLADAAAITAGTAGRVVDAAQLKAHGVHVGETAPANPKQGKQWFRSDTGKLYVWYDDGTGAAQWVVANPQEAVDYTQVYKKAESDARYLTATGPAFRVLGGGTALTVGTNTKLAFATKSIDTASAYNTTSNRFQPTTPGIYQIQICVTAPGTVGSNEFLNARIHLNGSPYSTASIQPVNGNYQSSTVITLVQLNGSTDYLEAYAVSNFNTTTVAGNEYGTRFEGFFIRPA